MRLAGAFATLTVLAVLFMIIRAADGQLYSLDTRALCQDTAPWIQPYCEDLDDDIEGMMDDALDEVCQAWRDPVQESLMDDDWGQFDHSWEDYRGNHDLEHEDNYHYGININHAGLTYTGETMLDRLENIAATMLHEVLHHVNPSWSHSQIESEVDDCIPGWEFS